MQGGKMSILLMTRFMNTCMGMYGRMLAELLWEQLNRAEIGFPGGQREYRTGNQCMIICDYLHCVVVNRLFEQDRPDVWHLPFANDGAVLEERRLSVFFCVGWISEIKYYLHGNDNYLLWIMVMMLYHVALCFAWIKGNAPSSGGEQWSRTGGP